MISFCLNLGPRNCSALDNCVPVKLTYRTHVKEPQDDSDKPVKVAEILGRPITLALFVLFF